MLHRNRENVNRQPTRELTFSHESDTFIVCATCLPFAERDAARIKANIRKCPKPQPVDTPTIGEIRQMLRMGGLPALLIVDAARARGVRSILGGAA